MDLDAIRVMPRKKLFFLGWVWEEEPRCRPSMVRFTARLAPAPALVLSRSGTSCADAEDDDNDDPFGEFNVSGAGTAGDPRNGRVSLKDFDLEDFDMDLDSSPPPQDPSSRRQGLDDIGLDDDPFADDDDEDFGPSQRTAVAADDGGGEKEESLQASTPRVEGDSAVARPDVDLDTDAGRQEAEEDDGFGDFSGDAFEAGAGRASDEDFASAPSSAVKDDEETLGVPDGGEADHGGVHEEDVGLGEPSMAAAEGDEGFGDFDSGGDGTPVGAAADGGDGDFGKFGSSAPNAGTDAGEEDAGAFQAVTSAASMEEDRRPEPLRDQGGSDEEDEDGLDEDPFERKPWGEAQPHLAADEGLAESGVQGAQGQSSAHSATSARVEDDFDDELDDVAVGVPLPPSTSKVSTAIDDFDDDDDLFGDEPAHSTEAPRATPSASRAAVDDDDDEFGNFGTGAATTPSTAVADRVPPSTTADDDFDDMAAATPSKADDVARASAAAAGDSDGFADFGAFSGPGATTDAAEGSAEEFGDFGGGGEEADTFQGASGGDDFGDFGSAQTAPPIPAGPVAGSDDMRKACQEVIARALPEFRSWLENAESQPDVGSLEEQTLNELLAVYKASSVFTHSSSALDRDWQWRESELYARFASALKIPAQKQPGPKGQVPEPRDVDTGVEALPEPMTSPRDHRRPSRCSFDASAVPPSAPPPQVPIQPGLEAGSTASAAGWLETAAAETGELEASESKGEDPNVLGMEMLVRPLRSFAASSPPSRPEVDSCACPGPCPCAQMGSDKNAARSQAGGMGPTPGPTGGRHGDILTNTLSEFGMGGYDSVQQEWISSLPRISFLSSERLSVPIQPPVLDPRQKRMLDELLK